MLQSEQVFESDMETVSPKVRELIENGGTRFVDQHSGRELRGVDRGINLISGTYNVVPKEQRVADRKAQAGTKHPFACYAEFRDGRKRIVINCSDIRRLCEKTKVG